MKRFIFLVCCVPFVLAMAAPASAHEHRTVGRFETSVGWIDEPTFAGFKNGVQFGITRLPEGHDDSEEHADGEHDEGTPVENAKLKVEVIFGGEDGTQRLGPLDLEPAFGAPGEYHAALIPTRPGVYTFHITGTAGSTKIDEFYTASDKTFSVVGQPTDIEFPAKDPNRQQLAQRVASVGEQADEVGMVRTLAIVGIVMAAAAIGLALGARKGRA